MDCERAMEHEFVVDVQGFLDSCGGFVPKEVALISLDNHYHFQGHWLISPPCKFSDLPQRFKRTNNWLTRNHHGIEWYEGIVPQDRFENLLREITRLAKSIYTRGKDKVWYLEKTLSREIINLEQFSPSLRKLVGENNRCIHHALLGNRDFTCAATNVTKLKKFINENRELINPAGEDTCGPV